MNKYSILNGTLSNDLPILNIKSAENQYLIDENNKRYVDLASGLWNVSLGYNNELNQNINKVFSYIMHNNIPYLDMTSYYNKLYNSTAEKILDFVNESSFTKVFYTNSGSESLELSLKIANAIKNGTIILSFSESYHGTFYGGMSISGISKEIVKNHLPNYEDRITLPFPQSNEEEKNFIKYVENHSKDIGAIFIEPIIGSGGIKKCSIDFYNNLIALCRDKKILTIFDEVATGFYKTGEKFFFKYLSHTPDIICMSKGLNNGTLPSGAVVINQNTESLLNGKTLKHMSTQNGNLLCLASISETLDFYKKYESDIHCNITELQIIIENLTRKYRVKYRAFGTMLAFPIDKNSLPVVVERLKAKGILVYKFNTKLSSGISLFPPITIEKNVFEASLEIILKTIVKFGGNV
ncbi:aminotransferase class III-fold pyridoxal phosphate-dependent enzyme [Staphylococcus agnetis]|uniref:aminotransferase class III-fold pyridoxal phosphate-dependent enzyme n=1 Tax=Staphylococcus agnetis TaxID=985762 RepID=UPI00208EB1E4|nr:aminotransferase class III-fold pyridoxal phosphate-dependent enzyme [Staphylococcus agnetis]MCO4349240.1 aminotransferase class III-fold pyridoxal phosphate-dependent enzyme [Staphylococcus agnetis]MCO4360877.1 aminotransferase class III-fold pyridoxal phosphate-dependent enzyme [Staphylococcus agnetis]MCO4372620.1 aminotransferase class III-fold pyridoxal phosphate-dependent enzyme [Staphylococcus agnetis]